MAGKKDVPPAKAASKTAASTRQANLFQFYKRRSETTVESAAESGKRDPQEEPQSQLQQCEEQGPSKLDSNRHNGEENIGMDSGSTQSEGVDLGNTLEKTRLDMPDEIIEPIRAEPQESNRSPMIMNAPEMSKEFESPNAAMTSQYNTPSFLQGSSKDGRSTSPRNLPLTPTKNVTERPLPSLTDLTSPSINHKAVSHPDNLCEKFPTVVAPSGGDASDCLPLGSEAFPIDLRSSPSLEISKSKPLHPLFTRASKGPAKSVSSTATREVVPIDLRSSPSLEIPKSKTLHPLFARASKGPVKSIPSTTTRPKSAAAKSMELVWPDATCQHVKGPQSSFATSTSSVLFGSDSKRRPCNAPLLNPQSPNIAFLKAPNSVESTSRDRPRTTAKHQVSTVSFVDRESIISSLPLEHRNHPGISRLLNVSQSATASSVQSEMWSHKWRPRKASEVLGNEDNALYLKEWLHALTLRRGMLQMGVANSTEADPHTLSSTDNRGTKRPNVVRTVDKRRKKRRMHSISDVESDWIADDDEEVETYESKIFEEDLPLHDEDSLQRTVVNSPHKSGKQNTRSNTNLTDNLNQQPDFSTLTNTILLEGPPGSGKTATVYACAEELGWEVFEVYPGIGKRSGGNISSLIGDVGTNHLVGSRRLGIGTKHSSREYDVKNPGGQLQRKNDDIPTESGDQAIQQSIILLEEIDIMFKDDANFWPTVINIIKYSHRPVILTCNDASLLPQDDLPLQTCLHFQSCPTPLAVSFLQCLCLAENRLLSREQLEVLYAEKSYTLIGPDEPDEPPLPFPSQAPPYPDIRRSLNLLQFWCTWNPVGIEDVAVAGYGIDLTSLLNLSLTEIISGDLCQSLNGVDRFSATDDNCNIELLQQRSECSSYIDAYLQRRLWDIGEALAIDRYECSGDDEVGHVLLPKFHVIERSCGLPFYNRDMDIACETLDRARHVLNTATSSGLEVNLHGKRGITRLLEPRSLTQQRVANQAQFVSFLDDVISRCSPLLPRPAAVLDYTPYVRHMILVDDALEVIAASASAEMAGDMLGRRGRRRRGMGEYIRHLTVSEEGQQAARQSRLLM